MRLSLPCPWQKGGGETSSMHNTLLGSSITHASVKVWLWQVGWFKSTEWFIFAVTYLSVLPAHTTYTISYMTHIHLSNISLPERGFVKSPRVVFLKSRCLRQWNPDKFDPKFQETNSPMRYDISKKNLRQFQPPAASRGDQTLPWPRCSPLLFPVSTRHHWGNKIIPLPVPSILTGKPIAVIFLLAPITGGDIRIWVLYKQTKKKKKPRRGRVGDKLAAWEVFPTKMKLFGGAKIHLFRILCQIFEFWRYVLEFWRHISEFWRHIFQDCNITSFRRIWGAVGGLPGFSGRFRYRCQEKISTHLLSSSPR